MLATQLNHMVENKELEEFTIIRVNRLLTSMVNNNNQQKGEKWANHFELIKFVLTL